MMVKMMMMMHLRNNTVAIPLVVPYFSGLHKGKLALFAATRYSLNTNSNPTHMGADHII